MLARKSRTAFLIVGLAVGLVGVWVLFTLGPGINVGCKQSDNPRCREASGRVLYVEAVDPDGDGDMHLVLASRQSLTWPGITVLVIPRAKSPASVPRFGRWVRAIGLLNTGSHGETTLDAREFKLG
jgi:hypothetical protein